MARWFALACVLVLGACASSGHARPSDTTTSTTTAAAKDAYCRSAEAYQEATANVDVGTVNSTLAGFAKAALAARDMADASPPEVRKETERLAAAAEELVTKIRRRNPRTQQELEVIGNEVTAALEAKYGDLEPETNAAKEFAHETCGIAVG